MRDKPLGAKLSCSRCINCPACLRFSSPSDSVFHSGVSMSSIETKVSPPPMVRRTSSLTSSASMRSPSRSMAAHCCSLQGLVTRGSSRAIVVIDGRVRERYADGYIRQHPRSAAVDRCSAFSWETLLAGYGKYPLPCFRTPNNKRRVGILLRKDG